MKNENTHQLRFYKYIKTNIESGCWEFIGAKSKKGYGIFRVGINKLAAHRFSWILHRGNIPDGLYVLHKCDNPPCVNPEHLFLGTQLDNMQDMIHKGRNADVKGDKNPRANLHDQDVVEIRKLWDSGISPKELSQKFNTPKSTINNIIKSVTWNHLPPCKKPPSNRGSHLSNVDIQEIKRLNSLKAISQKLLGKLFKLSQPQISKIVIGDSWK